VSISSICTTDPMADLYFRTFISHSVCLHLAYVDKQILIWFYLTFSQVFYFYSFLHFPLPLMMSLNTFKHLNSYTIIK
jgi:hypothetical protein